MWSNEHVRRPACSTLTRITSFKSIFSPLVTTGMKEISAPFNKLKRFPTLASALSLIMTENVIVYTSSIRVGTAYLSPPVRSLKRLEDYSTLTIKELINTGSWSRGTLDLAGVVAGTAITAVSRVNRDKKREITMFYQTKTLFLKSHIYDGGWAPGQSIKPMQ